MALEVNGRIQANSFSAESAGFKRHLSHRQLAFVRAWAEGLDLPSAWSRYLGDGSPPVGRRARDDLHRLLDELGGIARAFGRADITALLRRDPEAIVATGPTAPTLDEFRAEQPADFYSEAELVELYQASHGSENARSPARRRQRLRARQVDALQWLDGLVARDPQPADPVSAWLDERLARRLARVGVVQLQALTRWIHDKGPRWYQPVPQMGPRRAERITAWLSAHASSLGPLARPPLANATNLAEAAPAGLRPLEQFSAPVGLDGGSGSHRATLSDGRLVASTDIEAVWAWLGLRAQGSHTWRAYRREAERCLLWAVLVRRKPLSSLTTEDCDAYRDFLAAPPVAWTAARKTSRMSAHWRPFEGPLSARSLATAITILRALWQWLIHQHYLAGNPWDRLTPPAASRARVAGASLRALSLAHWEALQAWLADPVARPGSPAAARLGFVVHFAQATGLRLSELVAARMDWLHTTSDEVQAGAWTLHVPGTRSGPRAVPLPAATVAVLQRYLVVRGLSPELRDQSPATPIIAQVRQNAPLSPARLYEVLVDGFTRCAAHLALTDPQAAEQVRQATTHWLRHTHGVHAIGEGVSGRTLRARMGHRSPTSTAVYTRAVEAGRQSGY